jgi:diguanylate cyclase (GGDEF)-like protein
MLDDPKSVKAVEKHAEHALGIYWINLASYSYELLTLTGFWLAGYLTARVLLTVVIVVVLVMAGNRLLLRRPQMFPRVDPGLFLPHQIFAMLLAFGVMIAAPQIAVQPLATLTFMGACGFIAPNRLSSFISFGGAVMGTGIAIALVGSRLALPVDSTAGQFLTWWVTLGTLTRCLWLVDFVRRLQDKLRDKRLALDIALARIETLVNIDELTGLDNRRSLFMSLIDQIALHDRADMPLCVAVLDVDHFKNVNDTFGHAVGDRVLQAFAKRAQFSARSSDRLYRYGGEEFVLVLPHTVSRESVAPLDRIRLYVAETDWTEVAPDLRVTVTIGATQYRSGETVEQLLQRADAALYRGKAAGRNRVVVDTETAEEPRQMQLRLSA